MVNSETLPFILSLINVVYCMCDATMYIVNSAAEIHITAGIVLALPSQILRTTHEIIPNMIPLAIDIVNGIITIAINAAITSDIGTPSKWMFLI